MRYLLNTPTKALLADVVCWSLLVGLLICVGVTAENQLLAGVMLTVATLLGTFAVLYNGRNATTVVRSKLNARRYRREEAVRRAEYESREAARLRDDAAYGNAVARLNQQYGR